MPFDLLEFFFFHGFNLGGARPHSLHSQDVAWRRVVLLVLNVGNGHGEMTQSITIFVIFSQSSHSPIPIHSQCLAEVYKKVLDGFQKWLKEEHGRKKPFSSMTFSCKTCVMCVYIYNYIYRVIYV